MKYNKNWYFLAIIFGVVIFFFFMMKENYISEDIVDNNYIKVEGLNKETCLNCHINTLGYSSYHNPELIGCASCHLGNMNSTDKEESHKGMVLIPGNLSDAKDTCGKCHPNELAKIKNSLMTTNSGLIAVDKYIFGEANSPNEQYHIQLIKNSASDKHIRDLCANCHLGAEKKDFGAITQMSRGGGCNACHLNYSEEAKKDLQKYISSNKKVLPKFHPATNIFVKNEHCFGCHSRSSRISTNYEGWQETLLNEEDVINKVGYKVFEDKRVYKYIEEDAHHAKGLLCIDCHSSHEVMGDGKKYAHQEDAVKMQCSDCHSKGKLNTIPYSKLDQESLLVFLHRNYSHNDKQIIVTKKDNNPLVNTYVDTDGKAYLIGKKDNKLHELKPQPDICSRDNAHKNVSCSMCHSSWTSKCIGCHNQFDKNKTRAFDLLDKKFVKGQWKEYVGEFSSSLPSMGVKGTNGNKIIKPALPGMILTIDKGSYSGKRIGEDVSFHRLYAPNSPHTTVKKARDCKSCHANSTALGYGSGELNYSITKGKGKWTFKAEYDLNANDNLPEDAWIDFLKEPSKTTANSTRSDFRPFSLKEQKQLLLVGACLNCHKEDSKVMQRSLVEGIEPLLKSLHKKCILPAWN